MLEQRPFLTTVRTTDPVTEAGKIRLSVLIVDDDDSMRQIIRRTAESRGHDCVTASSLREARAALMRKGFHLVLLDWNLPDGIGLTLCSEIRREFGYDMPFVFMITGRDGEDNVSLAIEAGIDDYMRKPIDIEQLSNRIHVAERQIQSNYRRQRAEEQLLATTQRFSQLMQELPEAVVVVRDFKFVYVNPAGATLLGYSSPAEALTVSWEDIVSPEEVNAFFERLRAIVDNSERPPPRIARIKHKDGSWIECELTSLLIEYDGQPAIMTMARDVRERQRLQQELLQADRMVSLGTLAAGVAHEINNPLAYVIANLNHIADVLPKVEDPATVIDDVLKLVNESKEGAERMRVIVRDLGSFSRAADESREPLSMPRVLDSCVNIAWNEIRHRGTLDREYGETPLVSAPEARLGQVFLNLLVNAAHALPEKSGTGKIILRTYSDRHGNAVVDVIDNGHGIDKAILPRVFDPFFTTKPKGVGTGLGLPISQSILSSLGGQIEVFSEVGKGTTFRVTLPADQSATVALRPSPRPVARAAGAAQVLIVDDEPAVGRALRRMIGEEHKVRLISSGSEALEILRGGEEFDIIFCDVMMPDVSGIELYEALRTTRPELLPRFIFMTGGIFGDRARDFFEHNEIRFLDKPFDLDQVRAVLDSRFSESPKPA